VFKKIRVLLMLRRGFLARRADSPADARREFSQAISLSRQLGSKRLLISALNGLAQIARDSGQTVEAVPLYEEAVSHSRGIGNGVLLAHTIRHLGDAHQDLDHLVQAEACYREALSLYRGSNATRRLDLANAVRPYALLKERTGYDSEARELWTEAHRLYSSVNARAGIDESASHLRELAG
jgi:tetratricopeptide (TPR) repeat protein